MAKASGSPLPILAALAVLAGAAFAVLSFLKKKGDDKEDGEAGSGPTIQAARSKDASDDANAIVPPSPAGEFHDASHEFVEESPRGTPVNIATRFAVEATSSAEADKDPKLTNGKHDDEEFVEAPSDPPAEEEEEKAAEAEVAVPEAEAVEAAKPEPAVDGAVEGVETEAAPEVVEAVPEVVEAVPEVVEADPEVVEADPEVVEETKEEEATSEVVQDGAVETVEEEEEGEEETQDSKVDELLAKAQGAIAKTDKVLEENAPKA